MGCPMVLPVATQVRFNVQTVLKNRGLETHRVITYKYEWNLFTEFKLAA